MRAERASGHAVTRAIARARWPDALPVLFAAFVGAACLASMSGLFCPDAVNFVAEAPWIGVPRDFFKITPGYPSVLAILAALAEPEWRMPLLCALQQAAFVATVWCVGATARAAGRRGVGRFASWAVALYLPYAWLAQTTQQEALYIAATAAATWLGTCAIVGRAPARTACAAGVLAGFAAAMRSVGLVVPVVLVGSLLCVRGVGSSRSRLGRAAALLAGLALALAAFVGKNAYQFGDPSFVNGTGIHLFGRVAVVDRTLTDSPDAEKLLDLAERAGVSDPFFPNAGWYLHAQFTTRLGIDPHAADDLLRTVALQTLTDDPVRTLRLSWNAAHGMADFADPANHLLWQGLDPRRFDRHLEITHRVWQDDPLKTRALTALPPYSGHTALGSRPFDLMRAWGRATQIWRGPHILPLLLALSLYALVRRTPLPFVAAGMASAQIVAAAVGDQPYPRYWEPCVWPFVLALTTVAADLAHAVRHRRDDPRPEGEPASR